MVPLDICPQGMALHSIGYATLKHPALPEDPKVPVGNQIGILQHVCDEDQTSSNRIAISPGPARIPN